MTGKDVVAIALIGIWAMFWTAIYVATFFWKF